MNGLIVFLVVAVPIVGIVMWMLMDDSIVKIEPGTIGLLLVHGKATDTAVGPGLHWVPALRRRMVEVYPSLEMSYRAGATPDTDDNDAWERGGPALAATLGDKASARVTYTIRVRLDPDRLRSVHERFGSDGLWSAIRDLSGKAVRVALNEPSVGIDQTFGPALHDLESQLTESVRASLADDGFIVTSLSLDEVDLGRTGEAIQGAVRARLELQREQAESAMRVERARSDAEVASLLADVPFDSALRYREADAWRELAGELVQRQVLPPARRDRSPSSGRADAAQPDSADGSADDAAAGS